MLLLIRLFSTLIKMLMIFCRLKWRNNVSAICYNRWWSVVALLQCPYWKKSQLLFCGATLPSWPLKACPEISSGKGYYCFSQLLAEETSKFIFHIPTHNPYHSGPHCMTSHALSEKMQPSNIVWSRPRLQLICKDPTNMFPHMHNLYLLFCSTYHVYTNLFCSFVLFV